MRIATYNVNGINGRLPVLLRWLEDARPDIVCLQELKASDDRFPEGPFRDLGYDAVWHGQKAWNGVAILSRAGTIHETRRGLPGDARDRQSRYLEAAIDGLLVATLYLPNGNPRPGPKFAYKMDWLARLDAHLAALVALDAPVVIAGDFNVMPTALDVYKPERWTEDALFVPEVRAAFAALVGQGWCDAVRHLHPGEPLYSFWNYWRGSFERDAGLRIDHLLLNPVATKRLAAAGVDRRPRGWAKTSDHAPVWIDLADRPARRGNRKRTAS